MADPIASVIGRWHEFLGRRDPAILDELLHDDVVFLSPIVYTPQRGKAITTLYLMAAGATLAGDPDDAGAGGSAGSAGGGFAYTKQVLAGHTAVLEFETSVEGTYVNGVDIIVCDDDGRIVEFRVMIRPLRAVNAVHAQMKAAIEAMQAARPGA